jgi:hypothetical protein
VGRVQEHAHEILSTRVGRVEEHAAHDILSTRVSEVQENVCRT